MSNVITVSFPNHFTQAQYLPTEEEMKAEIRGEEYRTPKLPLKYYPRTNTYKASNVVFEPLTIEAWSYDWWKFVTKIGQLTVFNSYTYSNSTAKHQSKVRSLMYSLGLQIHAEIECPKGLQSSDWFASSIRLYEGKIAVLEEAIEKPRSQAKKNAERLEAIKELKGKIKQVKHLDKMQKSVVFQ